MNLKQEKEVTSEHLPSLSNFKTQLISGVFDVNGAAIDASASDNEIPTSAAFKAPQSFAPSPQKPTE